MTSNCLDCGQLYGELGLDIRLSDEQWELVNPNVDGVLCANCVVKRAAKIDNVTIVVMELVILNGNK